ncbi:MAG: DUF169 domain-containing protein [Planctomycetota bacterium]|nr:DUF169 domain-containing protein [Planctomycetota bacterium]
MASRMQIGELLGLQKNPIAIAFREQAPSGVNKVDATAVSGCSYWSHAADGKTFYTDATDHYGCPVGAHTHGIELPEQQAEELQGLVGTMVELQYIDMEEVGQLPQLDGGFGVAIYAPLHEADFEPDVVVVSGNPKQMMVLAEAAHAAGIANATSMVGRPTCAAIPAALQSQRVVTNLGCIGNRVYTELSDDALYFVIPGAQLDALVERLMVLSSANRELAGFHAGRAAG